MGRKLFPLILVLTFLLCLPTIVLAATAPEYGCVGGIVPGDPIQITNTSAHETTPTLGRATINGTATDLVVYTLQPVLEGGSIGPGDIWYQRLTDEGAPDGAPVRVTWGPTDDRLNDVSGDYIVYTAYDSEISTAGTIVVYQISTGIVRGLGRDDVIQEPRIHGDRVVWREGVLGATMVMYYQLSWLGTGANPITLAGPVPPTFDVQIGNRFAVWSERVGGTYDVVAYDFENLGEIQVTSTAANDRDPATSGDWIVWRHQDLAASSIQAKNMDTLEEVTLDNGAGNFNPSIDGALVSWESNVAGNLDIWVYNLATGETKQVTTGSEDQYLNDVFGYKVAYVDASSGNEDIYVSKLNCDPCAYLGGDSDGDGVCYSTDFANIEVTPTDYDFGDVELGAETTMLFTISNTGTDPLEIFQVNMDPNEDNFIIQSQPTTIGEGLNGDIGVKFMPQSEGTKQATLIIMSNDPSAELVYITLSGTGVYVEPPPTEQIQSILDFINTSVTEGNLSGTGSGNSPDNRLTAFRNMTEALGDLIENGDIEEACTKIDAILKKCDGLPNPPDFLGGEALEELAGMLGSLQTSLGCQ